MPPIALPAHLALACSSHAHLLFPLRVPQHETSPDSGRTITLAFAALPLRRLAAIAESTRVSKSTGHIVDSQERRHSMLFVWSRRPTSPAPTPLRLFCALTSRLSVFTAQAQNLLPPYRKSAPANSRNKSSSPCKTMIVDSPPPKHISTENQSSFSPFPLHQRCTDATPCPTDLSSLMTGATVAPYSPLCVLLEFPFPRSQLYRLFHGPPFFGETSRFSALCPQVFAPLSTPTSLPGFSCLTLRGLQAKAMFTHRKHSHPFRTLLLQSSLRTN